MPEPTVPPLRERRREELRQQLTDTATALFLERGFDQVTVAEVARACGVTEKTVFNHFRSKEALLVDRWPQLTTELGERVLAAAGDPVAAVVDTLDAELDDLIARGSADAAQLRDIRRFGAMIAATPTLRDHRRRARDQVVEALHASLAARPDTPAHDAELRVTAIALSGLVDVFYRSLAGHLGVAEPDAATCRRRVRADVRRAARRLRAGLAFDAANP